MLDRPDVGVQIAGWRQRKGGQGMVSRESLGTHGENLQKQCRIIDCHFSTRGSRVLNPKLHSYDAPKRRSDKVLLPAGFCPTIPSLQFSGAGFGP